MTGKRSTGGPPATLLGGLAASDSRPGPPATACPGRAVSTWGRGSRDSRDGAAAVVVPGLVAAVVRVAAGDFVPRSSAPDRCDGPPPAGGCATENATSCPAGPRRERHPRRCRRQPRRRQGATDRQVACDLARQPSPCPLRSCTAADFALSACACNREEDTVNFTAPTWRFLGVYLWRYARRYLGFQFPEDGCEIRQIHPTLARKVYRFPSRTIFSRAVNLHLEKRDEEGVKYQGRRPNDI